MSPEHMQMIAAIYSYFIFIIAVFFVLSINIQPTKCSQNTTEGKVLEQKKLLQPLLGTTEGIYSGCIIIFSTSAPLVVYPSGHPSARCLLRETLGRTSLPSSILT